MQIMAEQALLPEGWAQDVAIEIGGDGRIASVVPDAAGRVADHRVGAILPAPVNAHSHGFQRAMAGLTERRGPTGRDSFWTWRAVMFRFLDHLTPEDIQAITSFVQMEMLEAGYGASVEFHYIHHQPGGVPYADLAELSTRCVAAAEQSGIGLALLPVMYQFGGCDGAALGAGQIRFGNDLDRFARLYEGAARALGGLPADAQIGVAPHSLRAVAAGDFAALAALGPGPIHLHLAEQLPEVDHVLAHYGARPVEWALDNLDLSDRWCMIHCTQMQPHETRGLAQSGAIAGLCPITEANLGDGIFDATGWFDAGGQIAMGSDSNIRIALAEELRQLDYSQRLRDHSRAALATEAHSTGRRLLDAITRGGAVAAGRDTGRIAPGAWADLMALDLTHPDLTGRRGDLILDTYAFAGDDRWVRDVWSAGRHMVRDGRHIRRDAIWAGYRRVMARLADVL